MSPHESICNMLQTVTISISLNLMIWVGLCIFYKHLYFNCISLYFLFMLTSTMAGRL